LFVGGAGYLPSIVVTGTREAEVGISTSVVLIAIGAILAFAVTATVSGIDLVAVGWILMAVGALGVIISLVTWDSWGGFGGRTSYRRRVVDMTDDPLVASRRRVVSERVDVLP
jgi:hypothetical protein